MSGPVFISIDDACERYSIGKTFFYTLLKRKGCPPLMKLGRRSVIEAEPFDAFIRSQMQPTVIEKNIRS